MASLDHCRQKMQMLSLGHSGNNGKRLAADVALLAGLQSFFIARHHSKIFKLMEN